MISLNYLTCNVSMVPLQDVDQFKQQFAPNLANSQQIIPSYKKERFFTKGWYSPISLNSRLEPSSTNVVHLS